LWGAIRENEGERTPDHSPFDEEQQAGILRGRGGQKGREAVDQGRKVQKKSENQEPMSTRRQRRKRGAWEVGLKEESGNSSKESNKNHKGRGKGR